MAKLKAHERRYHEWLIENEPCVCGCWRRSTVVHHPLQEHPDQGTRRNHEYVVPMHWECHNAVHARGSDEYAEAAAHYRQEAIDRGMLCPRA
jgi:hypothetical protein